MASALPLWPVFSGRHTTRVVYLEAEEKNVFYFSEVLYFLIIAKTD